MFAYYIQHTIVKGECIIADLKNLTNCDMDEKYVVFNISELGEISAELINRTNSVRTISIHNKSIQSTELNKFCLWPNLINIDAYDNNITSLQAQVLGGCHLLKTLSFAKSNIMEIYDDAFHGLSSLESLDLSNNQIDRLSDDIFHPLVSLKTLLLNNNKIGAIDKDNFRLSHKLSLLDLSYNSIAAIERDSFLNLKELRTLTIDSNPDLNSLDLKHMDKLGMVSVNNASLTFLHIPKNLHTISANANRINSLSIEANSILKVLHLMNNSFWRLDELANATALTELDISYNNITNIDFSYLNKTKIQTLNVLENPIRSFNVTALTRLHTIKQIEISTSFLNAQILEKLLDEIKTLNINLVDLNRQSEEHKIVTMPPVTPVPNPAKTVRPTSSPTTTVQTTTSIKPTASITTIVPSTTNNQSDSKDGAIKELKNRIQKLETALSDNSNRYVSASANSEVLQKVSNLRAWVIFMIVSFSIFIALKIGVFVKRNYNQWLNPIQTVLSNTRNGGLITRRNPFDDGDPILEEVL